MSEKLRFSPMVNPKTGESIIKGKPIKHEEKFPTRSIEPERWVKEMVKLVNNFYK